MDQLQEEIRRFFNHECKEDPCGKVKSKDLLTLYKATATFHLSQRQFTILFTEIFPMYQRTYTSKATTFYGFSLCRPLPKVKPRKAPVSNYDRIKKYREMYSPVKIRIVRPTPAKQTRMDLDEISQPSWINPGKEIVEANPTIRQDFLEKIQTFPSKVQLILENYYKHVDFICWVTVDGRLDMKETLYKTISLANAWIEAAAAYCRDTLIRLETSPLKDQEAPKDLLSYKTKLDILSFPLLTKQDVEELHL